MSQTGTLRHLCDATCVMVVLPGALMTPQQMVQAGLFEAVQQRRLALDMIALDLHALEGCNRTALETLEVEVLAPARAKYQQVWLTGISRGGLLALSCLAEQAGHVDGMCLLAPYPGSRLTINAIRRAGGLDEWQPTEEQLLDPEFRLWQWLKNPSVDVPLFVGHGTQDRFSDGMQLLAECLLPTATYRTFPGGHDWPAWLALWSQFLDLGFFKARP